MEIQIFLCLLNEFNKNVEITYYKNNHIIKIDIFVAIQISDLPAE